MNKSKREMPNKLRKKVSKEIRRAQNSLSTTESLQYSNELTAKEMLKKYPKKTAKKLAGSLKAVEKKFATKKKKHPKIPSKRTTPGEGVPASSTPANVHREGERWIKTLRKQNLTQRTIENHRGKRKK